MSLASVRADLVEALVTAVPDAAVYDHVPDNLDATIPALAIEPAEDYVTRSDTYSAEVEVRLDLWVLVPWSGDNETATTELDALLATVWAAIPPDFLVESTSKPMSADAGEWSLHGLRITLATITTL